jgi:hypothetical protein
MPAIDTIVGKAVNPSTTQTTVTFASGDSGTVRNFAAPDTAILDRVTRVGATSGNVRILSPLLHDNVRGITFTSPETPSDFLMPRWVPQYLKTQDTLAVSMTGGAAESDLASLSIYYSNIGGGSARLHNIGDVQPLINAIKPMVVAVTNSATIGTWTDTVITTTENLLQANTDYAILGYITDTALGLIGVKGLETQNLRIAGPGPTSTRDTEDFFVKWSNERGTPHIPVFNSANAGSMFVSTVDTTASSTANVQLVLGRLSQNLPN